MEQRNTLKDLIKEANLTSRELATRIGVKQPNIVALCRPGANPTLRTMMKLSKELRVSLDQLAEAFGEELSDLSDPSKSDPWADS